MVKLSKDDKTVIKQATLEAEQTTSAELAVVIAHASDEYRTVAMSWGLVLGSVVALLLWHEKIVMDFAGLLSVQLALALSVMVVPAFRHLCLRMASAHLLYHRAAGRGAEEYLHFIRHLPPSMPAVLLYVSLAERYVHIYTSRAVREKIPDKEWNIVVSTLTTAMRSEGLKNAVVKTVAHAGEMLRGQFPAGSRVHGAAHFVER